MKVIIAYDGSTYADAAIDDLPRAGLPPDSNVLVASVADFSVNRPAISEFDLISAASRRVDAVITQVRQHETQVLKEARIMTSKVVHRLRREFPAWKIHSDVLRGKPADELVRKVKEWDADLILGGSRGRSALGRFFLGSVSKRVAEQADSAVRIVRPAGIDKAKSEPIEIIAGVKNPAETERIVEAVRTRFWPADTRIRLVAIDQGALVGRVSAFHPDGRSIYESAAQKLASTGLEVSVQIETGEPKAAFLEVADAWRADAIFVVGSTNNRDGLDETASFLVKNSSGTVEIVR